MAARRSVRVDPAFFDDLDRQLPAERGPHGEPGAHDFLAHDLLRAVETFATAADALPHLFPDRSDHRVLIATGLFVARFAVVGRIEPDGSIVLVQLDVDRDDGR